MIVITKVFSNFVWFSFLGPTLVIMHSNEEPNSFFGGMAAPDWNSEGKYIEDVEECSWLFKLECEKNR